MSWLLLRLCSGVGAGSCPPFNRAGMSFPFLDFQITSYSGETQNDSRTCRHIPSFVGRPEAAHTSVVSFYRLHTWSFRFGNSSRENLLSQDHGVKRNKGRSLYISVPE
ncbi:hypothetical protein EDB87DRAFT_544404 [Lactarius vividus]|nr:hypothetical protein EDB87DRAFT_544404 [Lactarius vividus]